MINAVWPVVAVETEKRRLAILDKLSRTPGFRLARSILREHCIANGIPSTTAQMRAAFAWLEEQELVSVRDSGDGEQVAHVNLRGQEVAAGEAIVPGVWRPSP